VPATTFNVRQHGTPPVNEYVGVLVIDLSHDVAAAADARDVVARVVARLDMPAALAQDALLITSELVSNAVRHGGAPVRLEVSGTPGRLFVRVHDMAADEPLPQAGATDRAGGRGLQLVAALASDWGSTRLPDGAGKFVWAKLAW
jgi:anti-sigma regulatory factor (Ser/Thr protein kinase)